jgi:hypothetical protein
VSPMNLRLSGCHAATLPRQFFQRQNRADLPISFMQTRVSDRSQPTRRAFHHRFTSVVSSMTTRVSPEPKGTPSQLTFIDLTNAPTLQTQICDFSPRFPSLKALYSHGPGYTERPKPPGCPSHSRRLPQARSPDGQIPPNDHLPSIRQVTMVNLLDLQAELADLEERYQLIYGADNKSNDPARTCLSKKFSALRDSERSDVKINQRQRKMLLIIRKKLAAYRACLFLF